MRRQIAVLLTTLLAGLLAAPAAAQVTASDVAPWTFTSSTSLRVTSREYAPNMLPVVQRVAALCPGLILRDHEFTDAVATVLNGGALLPAVRGEMSLMVEGNRDWGRNGKRGNASDPSHDAIFFRTGASPFGGAVIDIIGSAGSPDASPAWIDQTDPTIAAGTTGVWVAPSGVLPQCLSSGSTPPPGGGSTPPPPTSTPAVDLRPVLEQLAALRAGQETLTAAVAALAQREPVPPDALLAAYVEAMVGDGPDGDGPLPPHITDLKQRLDVLRSNLEQLTAWLRSRAVLRY